MIGIYIYLFLLSVHLPVLDGIAMINVTFSLLVILQFRHFYCHLYGLNFTMQQLNIQVTAPNL